MCRSSTLPSQLRTARRGRCDDGGCKLGKVPGVDTQRAADQRPTAALKLAERTPAVGDQRGQVALLLGCVQRVLDG